MGFTGKQVIHPNQVPVVQRAFSPTSEQIAWARALLDAYEQSQQVGLIQFWVDATASSGIAVTL